MDDRSASVVIDGKEYELMLSTGATRDITAKYGGLEELGEKLSKNQNLAEALDMIVWLIAKLANQPIEKYNLRHPESRKPLLTEQEIELCTTPADLSEFKDAIMTALIRGTRRDVKSEAAEGNAAAG